MTPPAKSKRATTRSTGASDIPFVPPQLATLVDTAPRGDEWFHELKFDGFRISCRIQNGAVTLFTRTGQDWTDRFSEVADAAARLGLDGALIDGEIAILRPDGTTSFQALQHHLSQERPGKLTYFAFDLLYLDGADLRGLPLEERKARLAQVLPHGAHATVRYTDHVIGNGPELFEKASAAGLEGIVSKRRDEAYRGGRGPGWLKTKAIKRQEFVIGGFTEPEGARTGIGALLVGFFRKGILTYAGKVGTGFGQKMAAELRSRLDRLVTDESPFPEVIRGAGRQIHWVRPTMVAEIAYAEMTSDGKLRHPSFQGLRDDKPASEVVQEAPKDSPTPTDGAAPAAARRPKPATEPPGASPTARPGSRRGASRPAGEVVVAGVRLTHPDRVLEPEAGITKHQLASYYEAIAPRMLAHLIGRPLSLVRCPEGTSAKCFFMKHAAFATPELRRVLIHEKEEKGEYLIADNAAGLVGLAQMSVLEIHTWNAVEESLEMPDRVVFDFDPGPRCPWAHVVEGATLVKRRLDEIGCATFLKTTGGKGLHVVVPLEPGAGWDECRLFSQLVSESVVAQHPDRFTTAMRKAGREDKVLIDYFRNNRGSTTVTAYSTRARPGIPVSLPIEWDELDTFSPERPFTMATTLRRVEGSQPDPWSTYDAARVDLKSVILKDKAGASGQGRGRSPRP